MHTKEEFLWTEKYRPRTVADTILPLKLKARFQAYVAQGNVPNLLLSGSPGVGKTTIAKAVCDELDADWLLINGSKDRNIDVLRNEISNFASSVSLLGSGRKYVILDEADHLNPNSFQPALRSDMEQYSKNCGFILTCNYPSKIIDPLHSRLALIDFTIPKEEMPALAGVFLKRVEGILTAEGIQYEKKALAAFIMKWFPDWRKIIGELQDYSSIGKIDSSVLVDFREASLKELIEHMKGKKFTEVRRWVGENSDAIGTFYRKFYDLVSDELEPAIIPFVVVTLAKYQYQAAFAVDQEINLSGCLSEIMVDAAASWRK